MVAIKGDEQNKAQWKLGIITEVHPGKNGKVRAARLKAGTPDIERAIRYLYRLELSCDIIAPPHGHAINAEAEEFQPISNAGKIARVRTNHLTNDDRVGVTPK